MLNYRISFHNKRIIQTILNVINRDNQWSTTFDDTPPIHNSQPCAWQKITSSLIKIGLKIIKGGLWVIKGSFSGTNTGRLESTTPTTEENPSRQHNRHIGHITICLQYGWQFTLGRKDYKQRRRGSSQANK